MASTESTSAPPVYATIASFFAGQERWIFHEEPERDRLHFEYASPAGAWRTYVTAFEDERQVVVHGVLPFPVDEARRGDAMELVTRANFGLTIGNFELDLDDGETRFKTSVDFEGGELTEPLLLSILRANLAVMEHYLPALVAVAMHGASPVEALAAIEADAS